MKKLFALLFLLNAPVILAQIPVEDEQILLQIKNTPKEEVFVHYNSSLLLVGEYLYYNLYCLNSESEKFSSLSKTAYVDLVGEDGKIVFRHKLALEEGIGQGDFFIPTTVPSGNYKLWGYTRWMLNGKASNIFHGDLVIVNPYTNDQAALLEGPASSDESNAISSDSRQYNEWISAPLDLSTDALEYSQREKVTLTLDGKRAPGKYSLSVRKIVSVDLPMPSSMAADKAEAPQDLDLKEFFLPELRGELFSGYIDPKPGFEDLDPRNRSISLSLPDNNFIIQVSKTDEEGRFHFNIENYNTSTTALVQLMGRDREKFEIRLPEIPHPEPGAFQFANFRLTPEMKEMILERSVQNQIENGYLSVKPDTLMLEEAGSPFYGSGMLTYHLDDYTRFKTLKETFVEYIKHISIQSDEQNDDVLRVSSTNSDTRFGLPPLLIVDGAVVQEQGDLIGYPAHQIKSLGVLRDKYYLGAEVFQGVITVETINGDFHTGRGNEYVHRIELQRPRQKKNYYKQVYGTGTDSGRIPDFRTQLLWLPGLELGKDQLHLYFFTSDIPGDYEVRLEGFTNEGEPVSLRRYFNVNSRE